jgi:hypothetical protein
MINYYFFFAKQNSLKERKILEKLDFVFYLSLLKALYKEAYI